MNKEIEMSGEFDSEGNELTKEQAEFFKDSKVRDGQGRLLVCYHGTNANFDVFEKGDIGFHFGTKAQAQDIINQKNGKGHIDAYYLNIKNLIYIDTDLMDWNWNYFKKFLYGEVSYDEYEIYNTRPFGRQFSNEFLQKYNITRKSIEELRDNKSARAYLLGRGIDGIEYFNDNEDKSGGATSFIAFEPNQIKSISNLNPTDKDNINESYMRLDEATRNQLINKTKNSDNYKDQSKGKNRWDRRTKSRIANSVAQYNKVDMDALFKRDILTLGVDVHGETDDYVVTVRFIGLLKEVQREVKANKGKLEYKVIARAMSRVFNSGDVSLHCTCPDFKYRQSYNASKQNYGTQYEPRPSNITNPNDTKGGGCKHCMLVLSNLDWMMKVSSVINNYIKYCQNNLEYNYATYIFPKVYGVPYKQAVQQSLFDNGGYLASDQKTVGDIAKRNLVDKDDKGKFIVGNKYRFNKKQNGELEEPNEDQLKFNFDEKPKEVVPDENNINK